jgi:PAS domain S-box-containing protein
MIIDDVEHRRAMLAAIIDSSDDAIISKTLDGIITSWNHAAEKMFGFTEEEAVGQHIYLIIPKERRSEEEVIISKLKQGLRIEHFETIRATKSGQRLHISLTISPIKNSVGQIIGASKIARDITRQKQDAELIRKHTEQLELINKVGKTISAHLDVGIILQTVTDATTKLSGAAFGAFFYNKTDSQGETYMLYALSGAPREAFEKFGMPRNTQVFSKTFDGEGILRSDDITKDPRYGKNSPHKGMPKGHLPVVSYLAVPVISQTGVVIGGLFFGHPQPGMFTEEHERLVEAIASQAAIALDNGKLYEEIQALNSKKDEFIGFASHELRTPLTTISGYLQLAEESPEYFPEFLPKVNKQVRRLQALISDMLDISKIHAGKLDFNFQKTSLLTLIKDSIDSIKIDSHVIETDLLSEDVIVTIDCQKMSQVLINIISNAVKYSPAGSKILLSAVIFGDQVQISVKDNGIGIAQEHIDKLFSQFYRVTNPGNMPEGLGLGLYISKEIMDGHSGKISVESEEGKGSTFSIIFPIDKLRIK